MDFRAIIKAYPDAAYIDETVVKDKSGNVTYFSMDGRYRPFGSVTDSVKYQGQSLLGGMQGKYKPVNPSTSSQPIGTPLSVNDLKFSSTKV